MTQENNYTPAPWYTTNSSCSQPTRTTVIDDKGLQVCDCALSIYNEGQAESNANLIANAPELLEALEVMLEEYQDDDNCNTSMLLAMSNATKVIARARGIS